MSNEKIDNRFMEFRLGHQLYAIPLLKVREVIQRPEVTEMPNMPAHFEGMMNLRGQILGVFSVRKKLGAKARPATESANEVVIVIDESGTNVGITVDEVTKVLNPSPDMLRPAPLREGEVARDFVTGVIQSENELILTVDVVKLLELERYAPPRKASA